MELMREYILNIRDGIEADPSEAEVDPSEAKAKAEAGTSRVLVIPLRTRVQSNIQCIQCSTMHYSANHYVRENSRNREK